MTHEQKCIYFRIAANIVNIGINDHHADVLVSLYESVLEKKGKLTVRDITNIEDAAENRTNAKKRSKLLDQVSEKL